jgi:hypothetical protein
LKRASYDNGETVIAQDYSTSNSSSLLYNLFLTYFTNTCSGNKCVSRDSTPDENGLFFLVKDYKTFSGNTVYSYMFDNGQLILNDGTFIMLLIARKRQPMQKTVLPAHITHLQMKISGKS